MVEERITDGRRIAELFVAEVDGRSDSELGRISVRNLEERAEPSVNGTRFCDIEVDDETLATVFLHDDRIHLECRSGPEGILDAVRNGADEANLRVRPKTTTPPALLVFVESGAAVKRATDVLDVASATVLAVE